VHRGNLFPEYWWGLGGNLKSEKFTRRSRARHLQKGADGKLFDRRPSYCAVVLGMKRAASDKNLGGFQKFKTAELRSIEFLACGFRCVLHIHPSQASAIDERLMTINGGMHRLHRASRFSRVGDDRPQSSF
jgi:hypothetical protein